MSALNSTPSQLLAQRLAEKLATKGLARQDSQLKLVEKIASGNMKGDDWRLEIELATSAGGAK